MRFLVNFIFWTMLVICSILILAFAPVETVIYIGFGILCIVIGAHKMKG